MTHTDIFKMTGEFADRVCGIDRPPYPTCLDPERLDWFVGAAEEELQELRDAGTIEDQADAVLDLIYFSAGRLYEMGVDGAACFEAIHSANMRKVRGTLSKRPGSKGHDAVKPDGWKPPDLRPLLATRPPKLLVIGHGRHGKDTVCEMLRDEYGLRFTSSSLFCAERVIWPILHHSPTRQKFLSSQPPEAAREFAMEAAAMAEKYEAPEFCFDDRHGHRAFWYEAIRDFNRPDATALGRAIFAENDVYCGLRSKAELNALHNAGEVDFIVWVDRSDHVPPEDASSCTVEPWMAHFVVDNNGDMDDLRLNLNQLMRRLLP